MEQEGQGQAEGWVEGQGRAGQAGRWVEGQGICRAGMGRAGGRPWKRRAGQGYAGKRNEGPGGRGWPSTCVQWKGRVGDGGDVRAKLTLHPMPHVHQQ